MDVNPWHESQIFPQQVNPGKGGHTGGVTACNHSWLAEAM